jgi:hypothetical protein
MKSKYLQTWANNQLRVTTTRLQRPRFWGPFYTFILKMYEPYFWIRTNSPHALTHFRLSAPKVTQLMKKIQQISIFLFFLVPHFFWRVRECGNDFVSFDWKNKKMFFLLISFSFRASQPFLFRRKTSKIPIYCHWTLIYLEILLENLTRDVINGLVKQCIVKFGYKEQLGTGQFCML